MSALQGKKIVFTGTLTIKRADAKKKAQDAGAHVLSAVSGQTDIAVCGPGAGSKKAIAESYGAEIWDEARFIAECEKKGGKKRKASAPPKAQPAKKQAKKEEPEEEEEEDYTEAELKKVCCF